MPGHCNSDFTFITWIIANSEPWVYEFHTQRKEPDIIIKDKSWTKIWRTSLKLHDEAQYFIWYSGFWSTRNYSTGHAVNKTCYCNVFEPISRESSRFCTTIMQHRIERQLWLNSSQKLNKYHRSTTLFSRFGPVWLLSVFQTKSGVLCSLFWLEWSYKTKFVERIETPYHKALLKNVSKTEKKRKNILASVFCIKWRLF